MADTRGPTVKKEDYLALLKAYAPVHRSTGEKDMIDGRYRVIGSQRLQELSTASATAFLARDEKNPEAAIYALVFEGSTPLRQKNMTALKTFRHPSMVSLLTTAVAEISAVNDTRFVAILERPSGQPLSKLIAVRRNPPHESVLLNRYLRPLTEVLSGLSGLRISHNRIHPGNIYLTDTGIMLGECIGEPSGFSQDYLFEPIERVLTLPAGKADYAPDADCYALGMLALQLSLGFNPFATRDKETLVQEILQSGTYHALVARWDLPANLQDFFRGLMGDGIRDRWDAETLQQWASGRRFNLVLPKTMRETQRGFLFNDTIYYNRKSLADAMARHWKEARALLAAPALFVRWLARHINRQDLADAITRVISFTTEHTPQQEDEALSKVIMLLDPQGPVRLRQISTSIEGIGALLAEAFIGNRKDEIAALMQIIDVNLHGFWIDQQKTNNDYSPLKLKMRKVRQYLRMSGLGFGMERCLYDMNPGLPCLSPLLKVHSVTTLADALKTLDSIAKDKAGAEDVGDVHVAAFVASRLDLSKEIALNELYGMEGLSKNPTLMMLKLLAHGQRKSNTFPLKGLCYWFAVRLMPLFDGLHSRDRQRTLSARLMDAAATGSLDAVADLFLSGNNTFAVDFREFQNAAARYAAYERRLANMQGTHGIRHEAALRGLGLAQGIAYALCIASIYTTLKSYLI